MLPAATTVRRRGRLRCGRLHCSVVAMVLALAIHHCVLGAATDSPSQVPTEAPSTAPTLNPTAIPTPNPTLDPTPNPTLDPTPNPTLDPTPNPTLDPTPNPTLDPTPNPTSIPTPNPTLDPTPNPTSIPTPNPTTIPTTNPTSIPTANPTPIPTTLPTPQPSMAPTTPFPTVQPTLLPSDLPSGVPTPFPSRTPSVPPTPFPSTTPTMHPSHYPTGVPTPAPTPFCTNGSRADPRTLQECVPCPKGTRWRRNPDNERLSICVECRDGYYADQEGSYRCTLCPGARPRGGQPCSGRGFCEKRTGTCVCDSLFHGDACEDRADIRASVAWGFICLTLLWAFALPSLCGVGWLGYLPTVVEDRLHKQFVVPMVRHMQQLIRTRAWQQRHGSSSGSNSGTNSSSGSTACRALFLWTRGIAVLVLGLVCRMLEHFVGFLALVLLLLRATRGASSNTSSTTNAILHLATPSSHSHDNTSFSITSTASDHLKRVLDEAETVVTWTGSNSPLILWSPYSALRTVLLSLARVRPTDIFDTSQVCGGAQGAVHLFVAVVVMACLVALIGSRLVPTALLLLHAVRTKGRQIAKRLDMSMTALYVCERMLHSVLAVAFFFVQLLVVSAVRYRIPGAADACDAFSSNADSALYGLTMFTFVVLLPPGIHVLLDVFCPTVPTSCMDALDTHPLDVPQEELEKKLQAMGMGSRTAFSASSSFVAQGSPSRASRITAAHNSVIVVAPRSRTSRKLLYRHEEEEDGYDDSDDGDENAVEGATDASLSTVHELAQRTADQLSQHGQAGGAVKDAAATNAEKLDTVFNTCWNQLRWIVVDLVVFSDGRRLRAYSYTLAWKLLALVRLSVGYWNSTSARQFRLYTNIRVFDASTGTVAIRVGAATGGDRVAPKVQRLTADTDHTPAFYVMAATHGLFWQVTPFGFAAVLSKLASALNQAPLFVQQLDQQQENLFIRSMWSSELQQAGSSYRHRQEEMLYGDSVGVARCAGVLRGRAARATLELLRLVCILATVFGAPDSRVVLAYLVLSLPDALAGLADDMQFLHSAEEDRSPHSRYAARIAPGAAGVDAIP